jgi:hypothetical protein
VSDHIRAAGGTLRFDGKVGKDISVAGGSITFGKTAVIDGNILAGCGTILINGVIGQNAKIAAGDLSVAGAINHSVEYAGRTISILPGAKIGGDLCAQVHDSLSIDISKGTVAGSVSIKTEDLHKPQTILGYHVWHFWFKIVWMVGLLVSGFVFVFLFPKYFASIGSAILHQPGQSFVWGIVALVVTPIIIVILLVTVIGIPVALLLITVYLWLMYLSQLTLGIALGQQLFGMEGKTRWNIFWSFAVGLLIVQVITFIPYLGGLIVLAGILVGVGALLLAAKSEFPMKQTAG